MLDVIRNYAEAAIRTTASDHDKHYIGKNNFKHAKLLIAENPKGQS